MGVSSYVFETLSFKKLFHSSQPTYVSEGLDKLAEHTYKNAEKANLIFSLSEFRNEPVGW